MHLYQDYPGQTNWSRLSPSTCLLWIVLEGKAEEIIQVVKVLFGSHSCFFLQMYGQLDVLINCGGVSVRGGAVETLLEVHKRVMDTNYFGTKSQSW